MCVQYIHNDQDYEKAIELIDRLWSAEEGSADFNQFEVLVELIDGYEKRRWPMDLPDPIDAINFYMRQKSLCLTDLEIILGSAQLARDLLNKKILLSLEMIQKIYAAWGIPAESLIKPYSLNSVEEI